MKQKFIRLVSFVLLLLIVTSSLSFQAFSLNIKEGMKIETFHGNEYKDKSGNTYVVPEDTPYFVFEKRDGEEVVVSTGVTKKGSIKRKLMIRDINNLNDTQQVMCVEAGIPFGKYVTDYVGQSAKDSDYFKDMPDDKVMYIAFACLCGWQPGRTSPYSSCNEDDYALATQIIIWEIQQGLRTSATKIGLAKDSKLNVTVPADAYYSIIKGRAAEKCYNYILAKMAQHGKIPSFSTKTKADAQIIPLMYDSTTKTYKATVTDTESSYSDIKFTSGNISVTRNGTQYTFETKTALSEQITLCGKKEIDTLPDKMLVWSNGKDQAFATGADDPVEFYIGFRTAAEIPLTVIKNDKSGLNNIADIEFTITSSDGTSQTCKTDKNGTFSVNLTPGTYTVTEVVPLGYREQEPQTVTLALGDTSKTLTFDNDVKNVDLTIKKIDISGHGKIADIEFTVTGSDGVEVYKGKTDKDGIITLQLPPGTYTVTETVPNGYIAQQPQSVTLAVGDTSKTVTFENDLTVGRVTVRKSSEDGVIGGVVFRLHGTSTAGVSVDITVETNRDGVACFENVPIGEYSLDEVNVPDRYVTPESLEVVVNGIVDIEYEFENVLKCGSLKLIKTSYDGNVRGFSFRITNDDGYDEIFTTDENGEIHVGRLLPGEYTVSEIADEASEGYIRPEDTVVVIQFDTETVIERHNGEIPEVPNPPTGENHVLLLVILASCAACAIIVVICKEK